MVSRMQQHLKRLVWTLTGRNFRGLENIITVDGNLEDRRARLNMQEIWLSSWMSYMNSMKTGSFIFFWIRLQKVWQKRLEEPPEPDWTVRYSCGMRKMMWLLESAGYRKHWYLISCRFLRSRNMQCRSLEPTSMIRNPSKRGRKCR